MPTVQSEVTRLERVLVKHARAAFPSDAAIDRQWQDLHYLARPDADRAAAEYDGFLELLTGSGVEVHCLSTEETGGLDTIFVLVDDIVCDQGCIISSN